MSATPDSGIVVTHADVGKFLDPQPGRPEPTSLDIAQRWCVVKKEGGYYKLSQDWLGAIIGKCPVVTEGQLFGLLYQVMESASAGVAETEAIEKLSGLMVTHFPDVVAQLEETSHRLGGTPRRAVPAVLALASLRCAEAQLMLISADSEQSAERRLQPSLQMVANRDLLLNSQRQVQWGAAGFGLLPVEPTFYRRL